MAGSCAGEYPVRPSVRQAPVALRLLFVRTFTAEATGKPAPVICVDVGVVFSPRNGYVRKAAVDRQLAFLCVRVDQHSIAVCPCGWSLRHHRQGAGARTDSQSVGFSPNSTHCHSFQKTKLALRVSHDEAYDSKYLVYFEKTWRREWDSNPRYPFE